MGDKTKGLNDFYNGTLLFFPPLEHFDFHSIFSVYQWRVRFKAICIRIKSHKIVLKKSIFLISTCNLSKQNLKEETLEYAFGTNNQSRYFVYEEAKVMVNRK